MPGASSPPEVHRHRGLDRLVEADLLEVDVGDPALDRILLVLLEHGRVRRLLPLEHDVEDRVQPAAARERTAEVALGHRDRVRAERP